MNSELTWIVSIFYTYRKRTRHYKAFGWCPGLIWQWLYQIAQGPCLIVNGLFT